MSTLRRMVQAPIMPLAHAGHTFSTHAHDTAEQGAAGQGHVTAKAEVAASAQVVSVKVQRGERGGKDTLGRAREEAHEAKEHLERAGEYTHTHTHTHARARAHSAHVSCFCRPVGLLLGFG